jgi:dethiobiotin synthetase
MKGCFITGTDTGIGKTFFTALWTKTLREAGVPALALKPICCGERTDVEILAQANEEKLTLNQINPVHLLPPLAPYTACVVEDKPLDLPLVESTLAGLARNHPGPFLIEGVGGWLVPLTRDYWIRDWARDLALPVVVVARASLGTINHTLLTVESIRSAGLQVRGIIVNFNGLEEDMATQTNPAVIEDLTGLPILNLDPGALTLALPEWLTFPE